MLIYVRQLVADVAPQATQGNMEEVAKDCTCYIMFSNELQLINWFVDLCTLNKQFLYKTDLVLL